MQFRGAEGQGVDCYDHEEGYIPLNRIHVVYPGAPQRCEVCAWTLARTCFWVVGMVICWYAHVIFHAHGRLWVERAPFLVLQRLQEGYEVVMVVEYLYLDVLALIVWGT